MLATRFRQSTSILSNPAAPPQANQVAVSTRLRFLPLIIIEAYLTLTVLMFAFGPWPWPITNHVLLYTFLFGAQCMLFLGYLSFRPSTAKLGYRGKWSVKQLFIISLIVNTLWIHSKISLRTGINNIHPSEFVSRFIQGLLDPGSAYFAKLEIEMSGATMLSNIHLLIAPIIVITLPLGFYLWTQLPRWIKCWFCIIVLIEVASWVAIGTNKGVIDTFILIGTMILLANARRIADLSIRTVLRYGIPAALLLLLVVSFFLITQTSRRDGSSQLYNYSVGMPLNTRNVLISGLNEEQQAAVGYAFDYVNQGYYALALALEEPFISTYGFGNSFFWSAFAPTLTGIDVRANTLPARLESRGIDMFIRWHTFYTWWASDISFLGVIVLMFVIGRLLAMAWIESLFGANPFAIPMLSLLAMILIYVPANNQVLAFMPTAVAFYALLGAWLFFRSSLTHQYAVKERM